MNKLSFSLYTIEIKNSMEEYVQKMIKKEPRSWLGSFILFERGENAQTF